MKTLATFILIFSMKMVASPTHFSGEDILSNVPILENTKLSMYVDSEEHSQFFKEALFIDGKEELRFVTRDNVEKITVYKNGQKKVYVLPVKTNKVRLGLSMFDKGIYELVFETSKDLESVSTFLEVF